MAVIDIFVNFKKLDFAKKLLVWRTRECLAEQVLIFTLSFSYIFYITSAFCAIFTMAEESPNLTELVERLILEAGLLEISDQTLMITYV